MRRILNIVLIMALVLQWSGCLRLHAHKPLHRFAESPEQLSGLSDAEIKIQAQLSILNLQISATNNTINKNIYMASVKNGALTLTPFTNQNTATDSLLCLSLNSSQSQDVQLYISSIDTKLDQVRTDIQALGSASKNQPDLTYLKDKYHRTNQYYKYLLLNPCEYKAGGQPTITTFPPDAARLTQMLKIAPTEWFADEFSENYIGSAPSSTCPKQTPFVVGGSCQRCGDQTPYYDVSAKKCVNCPASTYFSQISHSCQKISYEHCNGGRYETEDGVCVCRTETPFWDGTACVACFVPNYFNFKTQRCVSCPSGYYHNGVECTATNCTQTFTFDIYHRRCVCPWYQPKLVNNTCQPCDPGQVYNNYTRQCQPCPDGTTITPDSVMCLCSSLYQTYSFATNTCECPYNTPILNENGQCVPCDGYYDAVKKQCLDCPIGSNTVKDPNTGICECSADFPLLAGGICRTCPDYNYYFDVARSKCALCPNGMSVSLENNTCMCFYGQIYANQSCLCPKDKPNLGREGCISCAFPKYFNQGSRVCQSCPAGYEYNKLVKSCVKVDCGKDKIYIEASQSCKCINKTLQYILPDGNCSFCPDYQYEEGGLCKNCTNGRVYNYTVKKCGCNQTENMFWNLQQCIKCEHPKYWDFGDLECKNCPFQQIYNIFSNQCEYCPAINPYFNGQYCTICPNNQYYNSTTHKCTPCANGKIYDNIAMQCICPDDHPIDTTKGCIQCYLPNYFDVASQSCLSCPKNTAFNQKAGTCLVCPPQKPVTVDSVCVPCPDNQYFNQSTRECQRCSANRNYNKQTNLCVCPSPSQFFDGSKCLYCYLPQYFDLADLKCKSCPQNQIYDPINYRCSYCPAERPLLNGSQCVPCPENTYFNSSTFGCQKCSGNRLYNTVSETCECPRNKFWNDASCVECYHPKYFDFSLKLCLSCPKNQIYDISLKSCTQCPIQKPQFDGERCVPCPSPTYWNYTEKDCINCTGGRVYDSQIDDCKCQKASTFFNGVKCIECYHPKYFDFSLLKCVSCPHNKIYDLDLKTCVDCPPDRPLFDGQRCVKCQKGTFWNISQLKCASCTGGRIFNEESQLCQCPVDRFWNDVKCIECFIPRYFDFHLKQCLSCPPRMVYDINQRLCVNCPEDRPYFDGTKCSVCEDPTYYDPALRTCTSCTMGRVYNKQSLQCECATGKFWTGYSCIECFHPKYFDLDERKCLNCPTNQVYSIEQRKCVDCPFLTPIFNGVECVKCPEKQYYDSSYKICKYCSGGQVPNSAGVCECPQGLFWTGNTCIQCYHPRYFDYESKQCLSCPINQVYNLELRKCLDCPSQTPVFNGESCVACPADKYYNTQYKSCQNCAGGQVINTVTHQCQCTNGRFWTGTQCIQCYHPQYFDMDQRKCMSCPANQLYNIALKLCDYCPAAVPYFDGQTCLACPRGSVFDQITRQCLACSAGTQFDQATGKCQCPDQSFWNGSSCVTCYLPQYFDLDTKKCKDCPEGEYFDRVRRICLPSP